MCCVNGNSTVAVFIIGTKPFSFCERKSRQQFTCILESTSPILKDNPLYIKKNWLWLPNSIAHGIPLPSYTAELHMNYKNASPRRPEKLCFLS